ncbi:hypothetical protein TrRE_jg13244, partial [Triparma retinervis]
SLKANVKARASFMTLEVFEVVRPSASRRAKMVGGVRVCTTKFHLRKNQRRKIQRKLEMKEKEKKKKKVETEKAKKQKLKQIIKEFAEFADGNPPPPKVRELLKKLLKELLAKAKEEEMKSKFYPGKISKVNSDGTVNVDFNDGDKDRYVDMKSREIEEKGLEERESGVGEREVRLEEEKKEGEEREAGAKRGETYEKEARGFPALREENERMKKMIKEAREEGEREGKRREKAERDRQEATHSAAEEKAKAEEARREAGRMERAIEEERKTTKEEIKSEEVEAKDANRKLAMAQKKFTNALKEKDDEHSHALLELGSELNNSRADSAELRSQLAKTAGLS